MESSANLIEGLSLLSDALGNPISDLRSVLGVLSDDLDAAIPDYLGLTVTFAVEDNPLVITARNAISRQEVRSSLLLPLLPLGAGAPRGSVAFYSGRAGAFIDLAEDARWIFNLAHPPVLDSNLLYAGAESSGIHGLAEISDVNQAVGVLVQDGYSQDAARTELRRRAYRGNQTGPEAARDLLDALGRP